MEFATNVTLFMVSAIKMSRSTYKKEVSERSFRSFEVKFSVILTTTVPCINA